MKYIISFIGIITITFVTIVNFYPEKVKDFIEKNILKKEYVIAKANPYYLDYNIEYIKNYTDDVNNKEELLNYIYYVINTGSTYADGECTKEYKDCTKDIKSIAEDEKLLSVMNNFVHPYNSFKTLSFTYNDSGKFSIIVEHIYSDNEIAELNYVIDDVLKNNIVDSMSNEEKIRVLHNYIINNTEYDSLKTENINDDTYKSNTAYGVLIQGYGICSGYSDTMSILLNNLGIENYKISNDTHIWNLVHINNAWVHLDATWDDPISEFNANRDTYFLIDSKKLKDLNDDTHSFDINIYKEAK